MSAMNLPINDRFWPVFMGCFVIGVMELGALLSAALGAHEMAASLDAYWKLGLLLSIWLSPGGTRAGEVRPGGLPSRSISELSLPGRLFAAVLFLLAVAVWFSESYLPAPWPAALHGAVVGSYLVIACVFAWRGTEAEVPLPAA